MTLSSIALFLLNSISLATPINVEKSTLKWIGEKPTSNHWGFLTVADGDIVIRDGQWIGGAITVDMTSMTVDDFAGPQADKLLRHLRNDDFFAVDKHETATLRIKSFQDNKVFGELTIKDQTHPISFSYTKEGSAYLGKMVFNRTLYGITYKSKSVIMGLGDKFIKDNVTVEFKIIMNN